VGSTAVCSLPTPRVPSASQLARQPAEPTGKMRGDCREGGAHLNVGGAHQKTQLHGGGVRGCRRHVMRWTQAGKRRFRGWASSSAGYRLHGGPCRTVANGRGRGRHVPGGGEGGRAFCATQVCGVWLRRMACTRLCRAGEAAEHGRLQAAGGGVRTQL
jgi:hypothetical protein